MPSVSIIIPVLNEAERIQEQLVLLRQTVGSQVEIILVDGGSTDSTRQLAEPYVDTIVASPKGRAIQMNTGAAHSRGDYLLFLHSDTVLPPLPIEQCFPFLSPLPTQPLWGFYPVKLSGKHWLLRIIERLMNVRSRLTHVATGDQCLFVQRQAFMNMSGFAPIALMEDVEITKRLRQQAPPLISHHKVTTSSRRWERHGIVKTVALMWYLRALYFVGVTPDYLAKKYY